MRLGKEVISYQVTGEPIYLHLVNSSRAEANLVAQEILDYKKDNPDLNNISILVRAVFQSREIEESLIKYSIPYRIIGGIKFYERSEIKDAVSYLGLVYESQDDVAFERALTVRKRGIGEEYVNQILCLATRNQNS